jgi:hypothetical protein
VVVAACPVGVAFEKLAAAALVEQFAAAALVEQFAAAALVEQFAAAALVEQFAAAAWVEQFAAAALVQQFAAAAGKAAVALEALAPAMEQASEALVRVSPVSIQDCLQMRKVYLQIYCFEYPIQDFLQQG